MNVDPEFLRLHVVIDGQVQGVGFRYFVLEKAEKLQVKGWVRNTSDGQVEVTAEGRKKTLDEFLEYLKQGPRMAYVTDTQQTWQPATGEYTRFNIVPSSY